MKRVWRGSGEFFGARRGFELLTWYLGWEIVWTSFDLVQGSFW